MKIKMPHCTLTTVVQSLKKLSLWFWTVKTVSKHCRFGFGLLRAFYKITTTGLGDETGVAEKEDESENCLSFAIGFDIEQRI